MNFFLTNPVNRPHYKQEVIKWMSLYFVLILTFSCVSPKNIDFQAMRPAKIKIGPDVRDVYIYCDPKLYRDSNEIHDVRIPFLKSLQTTLKSSPLLKNSRIIELKSSKFEIVKHSRLNGILLVLDSIAVKDTLKPKEIIYSNFEVYDFGIMYKYGCSTFDLSSMQMVDNFLLQDTFRIPTNSTEMDAYMAVWMAGEEAGEKYAHYLAPYWEDQTRIFYYDKSKFFKKAFDLIQMSQLDSAINVLKSCPAEKLTISVRAKLYYNLAVVYELKDDLEKALSMANSSCKLNNNIVAKEYAEKLRLRKLDRIALDWQLN